MSNRSKIIFRNGICSLTSFSNQWTRNLQNLLEFKVFKVSGLCRPLLGKKIFKKFLIRYKLNSQNHNGHFKLLSPHNQTLRIFLRSLSFKTCKILNQILLLHNSLNQQFFKNKSLCKINFATMLCANKKVIMKNAVPKFKKILGLLKRLNLNNKIMSIFLNHLKSTILLNKLPQRIYAKDVEYLGIK